MLMGCVWASSTFTTCLSALVSCACVSLMIGFFVCVCCDFIVGFRAAVCLRVCVRFPY